MGICKFCGKKDRLISEVLEVCRKCILNGDWDEWKKSRSEINIIDKKALLCLKIIVLVLNKKNLLIYFSVGISCCSLQLYLRP